MPFSLLRGLAGFRARKDARDAAPTSKTMLKPPSFETPSLPINLPEKSATFRADAMPLSKPVPGGWRAFDEDHAARLHEAYYDRDKKVSEVAQMFGVSTSTLLRWIDEMGWPSRRQMRQQSIAQLRDGGRAFAANHSPHPEEPGEALRLEGCAASANSETATHPSRRFAAQSLQYEERVSHGAKPQNVPLAEDIAATVRAELETVKARLHDPTPGAGERNARTLASLVRTLRSVEDLRAKGIDGFLCAAPASNEPPPRSLEELRLELIEEVEKMRAEDEVYEAAHHPI